MDIPILINKEEEITTKVENNNIVNNSDNDEHFTYINEDTIREWEKIILKDRSHLIKLAKDDSEILNEELDMANQRVIKNDCDRTRVKDRPLLTSFREYLESMLTYYCKKNGIKYKQGMNEILGPFILIKSKIQLSLTRIYNLISCFIEKYLTNYYYEDEFFSLQSSLALLNLLLKYHNPQMHSIFEFSIITPEMYATSWVLTIFANKSKLGVVYYFWNALIREDDELFIHFFIVAFLEYHKDSILSVDYSQIPTVLSQLNIKDISEVDFIFERARKIKEQTPYSLKLIAMKLEIFKPKSTRLKELFTLYEPESLLCLPILPSEVFFIAYNNIIGCPDYECRNFRSPEENLSYNGKQSKQKGTICNLCESKSVESSSVLNKANSSTKLGTLNYIFIDLRISEEKENSKHYDSKPGFLPMTVILDQKELDDEFCAENLSDRFLSEKEKYHFILITSETDYFKDYENKYYKEKITERERKKMMYGLQTRIGTEINHKIVKQFLKKDKSKHFLSKIKEFDNLKKIIANFIKKNYPYVSFVYGGFKEIHEQSIKLDIPLLNHDDSCYLCTKSRKKTQKFGFFSKFFKKTKTEDNLTAHHHQNNNKNNEFNLETAANKKRIKENENSIDKKEINISSKIFINLESNLSCDEINDKLVENINKLEVDESKIYNIEHISNLISDPNNVVFTCLLIEYKHLNIKNEKNSQIMLFLDNKEIKVYKLERNLKIEKILSNGENENLLFALIEVIKIHDIITIITKKQTKSVITLHYNSENFGKTSIVIDLITDMDSKNFITKTKQVIETSIKNSI